MVTDLPFIVNRGFDLFTMPFLLLKRASGGKQNRQNKQRHPMLNQMRRFLKDQSGAAAIEYGLLASGISVAIIPSVKNVGTQLVNVFSTIQHAF
jgi:pilus assembly protein Flp/PilA